MFPILSFKDIKSKHDVYRGKDFRMLKKKHKKKITLKREKLINQQTNDNNHMKIQKSATFLKKSLEINILKIKNITKLVLSLCK